ncbi:hypothetical protein [Palaeococcus sp. (in: euryarchaeotes)]
MKVRNLFLLTLIALVVLASLCIESSKNEIASETSKPKSATVTQILQNQFHEEVSKNETHISEGNMNLSLMNLTNLKIFENQINGNLTNENKSEYCENCQISFNKTSSTSTLSKTQESPKIPEEKNETEAKFEDTGTTNTTQSSEGSIEEKLVPNPFPKFKLPLNESLIHFYIYGSDRCGQCMSIKEQLAWRFGKESITFYLTYEGKNATILYKGIFEMFPTFRWIPVIGITYNGTLVAVVDAYLSPDEVEGLIKDALRLKLVIVEGPSEEIYYVGNDTKRAILESIFIKNKLPNSIP